MQVPSQSATSTEKQVVFIDPPHQPLATQSLLFLKAKDEDGAGKLRKYNPEGFDMQKMLEQMEAKLDSSVKLDQ